MNGYDAAAAAAWALCLVLIFASVTKCQRDSEARVADVKIACIKAGKVININGSCAAAQVIQ